MGRARALGVVGLARALALSDSLGPSGRRAGPIRRSASATRRAADASRSATGGRRTRRSGSSPSKAGRSRSRSCARAAHRTPQTSYDGTISASSSRPRRNAMFIGPTETRNRAPSSGASALCIRRVRARSRHGERQSDRGTQPRARGVRVDRGGDPRRAQVGTFVGNSSPRFNIFDHFCPLLPTSDYF